MTPALVVPVLGRKLYPGASVALDFTRNLYRSGTPVVKGSPSLLSGWTFTRASTGYAETAAGALVAFASGAPRITDKGLLVEEARTNYNTHSNALSSGAGLAFTSDVASAPDGTITAQRITKSDATTPRYSVHPGLLTVAALTTYTVSRFFKYDGHNTTVSLEFNASAYWNLSWIATFTVTASGITADAPSLCTSGVQALADGWYRCWATFTSGAAPTGVNGNPFLSRITGTTGVSVLTAFGQIEPGSFPTSYIPTTTASATRAADSATISGLTVASLHTLYSEVTHLVATGVQDRYAVLSNGANERTYLGRSSGGLIQGFTTAGGVTPSSSAISGAITTGTYKAGMSVGSASFVASRSGLLGTARANSPPSGLSLLTIGGEPTSVSPMNGYIRTLALYPYAFTDAQLQAATV